MSGSDHKTKVLCEDETCTHNVDGKCSYETITIVFGNYYESYEKKTTKSNLTPPH